MLLLSITLRISILASIYQESLKTKSVASTSKESMSNSISSYMITTTVSKLELTITSPLEALRS
jgi:uncharacterized protein YpmS